MNISKNLSKKTEQFEQKNYLTPKLDRLLKKTDTFNYAYMNENKLHLNSILELLTMFWMCEYS